MKLSLYNIEKEYMDLMDAIMNNDGEITPEQSEQLAINEANLTTKGTNYGFVIKQMEAEIEMISSEMKRLQGLKKQRENIIDRLKENIETAMKIYHIEEIKSPVLKINFTKSESVEITDLNLLESEYKKVVTTETADKVKIKEAIKSGISVQGATLQQNQNLQIK